MFESLLQIRYKIEHLIVPKSNKGSLIDPSLKLILEQIGFSNVQELDNLETISIADGQIISLPVLGEHGDLNIGAKNAYLIQIKGKSILCAADSNNIEPQLYQHIYDYLGNIDVMFISMECDDAPFTWAYGALMGKSIPRKMAETRRLDGSNAQKAIALVKQFSPPKRFMIQLEKLDIKLSLDGKELCINAPKGKLTSNLVAELKQRKPEIIALLEL